MGFIYVVCSHLHYSQVFARCPAVEIVSRNNITIYFANHLLFGLRGGGIEVILNMNMSYGA